MKKISFLLLVSALFGVSAFAAAPAHVINYFSMGDTLYADGTHPAVGENGEYCAVVWYSDEMPFEDFRIFNADGSFIYPEYCRLCQLGTVLEATPEEKVKIAKTQLQISDEHFSVESGNGCYAVFLLDTRRVEDGKTVCGLGFKVEGGVISITNGQINACGVVTGLEYLNEDFSQTPAGGDIEGSEARASEVSGLPKGCPQPIVSGFGVTNGVVTLTMTNSAPYLTYALEKATKLSEIGSATDLVGEPKQGVGAGLVSWSFSAPDKTNCFFKVIRKP